MNKNWKYKKFVTEIIEKNKQTEDGNHLLFENLDIHLSTREFTLVVYSMSKTRPTNRTLSRILWKHIRHNDPDCSDFIYDYASENFDDLLFANTWEERSSALSRAMFKRLEVDGYNMVLSDQLNKNWTPEKRSASAKKAWAEGKHEGKRPKPKKEPVPKQLSLFRLPPEGYMTPKAIEAKRQRQSMSMKDYWTDATKRVAMSLKKTGVNPEDFMSADAIARKRQRLSETKKANWTSEDTQRLLDGRGGKSPEYFMDAQAIIRKRENHSRTMKAKLPWEKGEIKNRQYWSRLEEFYEYYTTPASKHSNKGTKVGHRTAERHFGIPSLKTIFLWLRENGDPMNNQQWVEAFKT